MIDHDLAAAIAFTALGANLLGAVVLILLNAGSRSVRWYLPFQATVILWLLAQGSHELWRLPTWYRLDEIAAALLPLLFLLFALMESSRRPAWHALAILLLAAPLLPLVMRGLHESETTALRALTWAWFWAGWIGGPLILWRRGRREARSQPRPQVRRKLAMLTLLLLAPVSVVGAMFAQGPGFVLYFIPIVTIVVQFLIFYGVTRMQLYDIEVRVRRSGDIAARTAETERLAVLGEVAATVAHEVRNPLTGVRSLAQRIAHDEVPAEKRRQYAAVILEETGRVERLVGNLLELARRTPATVEAAAATPLAPLFDDLLLLVATRAEQTRVTIDADAHDLAAAAPRETLTQALLNLLLNALEHAPPGSVVQLSAGTQAGAIAISVRDHGPGIPEQERERVFEPFYTTTATGTGLGLSAVRHLAREHGWSIACTDAPGGGTTFTLVIPPAP